MIIDGLGSVTFANDVLRVETTKLAPNGEVTPAGDIEIPKSSIDAVVNGLVVAVNQINEKLLEASEKQKDAKETDKGKKKN
jgi:hypothetical protein